MKLNVQRQRREDALNASLHNVAHPVLQELKALQAVTVDNQELLALPDSFVSLSVLRHLNISNLRYCLS